MADKEHVWHASSILNAGHHIFTHILSSLSQHSQVRTLDEQLTQGVIPATDAIPVFRLSFTTANRDGKVLSLRQLTTAEVDQVVKGKTNVRQRAGFVPYEWVQSIVNRKAKYVIPARIPDEQAVLTRSDQMHHIFQTSGYITATQLLDTRLDTDACLCGSHRPTHPSTREVVLEYLRQGPAARQGPSHPLVRLA